MEIVLAPEVLKKLRNIVGGDRNKIERKIKIIQSNPLAGKLLLGEWSGYRSMKVWPLRTIYTIDRKTQTIYIHHIDYRGDVYKN